jgi:hypothetical protein
MWSGNSECSDAVLKRESGHTGTKVIRNVGKDLRISGEEKAVSLPYNGMTMRNDEFSLSIDGAHQPSDGAKISHASIHSWRARKDRDLDDLSLA